MPRRHAVPSLRRSLMWSVLAAVAATVLSVVAALSATHSAQVAVDRDTEAMLVEQRTADRIVARTYEQQLEALRFVEAPDPARRATFARLGDEADAEMRQYLFHELSPAARLQVELMKETHAAFEVAALRAIELAERGDAAAARARLVPLRERSAQLDSAVGRFLDARAEQREALRRDYQAVTMRARAALALFGVGLLLLGLWLSRHLQRLVMRPLGELTGAAAALRAGDLLSRVPPQRHAELVEVATTFNAMADSIQATRETIEMQNEELRQSFEQLQETQDELIQHEKLSAMGRMLAGLAHELNNPLGGVLGLTQLLRAELADSPHEEARRLDEEVAAPMEREALRARDLVRSLLSFARKPAGAPERVALAETLGTAVRLRAHAYALEGKGLRLEVPPDVVVLADVQKLQHAALNVINNALDAMGGRAGGSLVIHTERDAETVRVHFDDEGPGFANVRAVFDPFYTTKPAGRGTGLGLALVEQFLNESGGSATAANRPGGGARVTFILRAAPTVEPPPAEAAVPRAPASPVSDSADVAPDSARARHVLVVDDEPSLREAQRRILKLEGFEVSVAANGEEALDILERETIDLVVTDLRMPGRHDGHALVALIQRHFPALAARTLVVTGDAEGAAGEALHVPVERIISKPFTRAEYVSAIRRALGASAAD